MARKKLLLPHNFSDFDRRVLDFVVDIFAPLESTEITLLHLYTPLPSIEVEGSSITGKLRENIGYLDRQISAQEAALKEVAAELVKAGFAENRIKILFKKRRKDIAAEILDLHAKENFDIVVLNRRPARVSRFFTGSVSGKLVASMKNAAVCIVA